MSRVLVGLASLLALLPATAAGAFSPSLLLAPLVQASRVGMQVSASVRSVSPRGLDVSYHGSNALPPASTAKLFVSAAALSALGPGFRYRTTVTGPQPVRGVINGNIVLVGGGDPSLSAGQLDALAQAIAHQAHQLRGQVLADAAHFGGPPPLDWPQAGRRQGWYPRISALTLHDGNIKVRVTPTTPGHPPQVTVDPQGGDPVTDLALTTPVGTPTRVWVTRPHASTRVIVSGRIAQGHPVVKAYVSIPDPVHFTLRLFIHDLRAHGVQILGAPVPAAPSRVLASIASQRLAVLLAQQNRKSLNLYAEALLRTLGAVQPAGVGSARRGILAMDSILRRMGVAAPDLVDGCGLSSLDQVSARNLTQLLVRAAREPWFHVFRSSLPMAGPSPQLGGTLTTIGLFRGAPAQTIWAKTGNVGTAETLAGYVRTASGLTAFAVLTNRDAAWTQGFDVGVALARTLANQ